MSLPLLQYNELVDKVTSSETKVSEMETTVEDLQWDIEKLRNREQKLNKHLAEAMEQVCLYEMQLVYLCLFSLVHAFYLSMRHAVVSLIYMSWQW